MFDDIRGEPRHPLAAPLWVLCVLMTALLSVECAQWYKQEQRIAAMAEASRAMGESFEAAGKAMQDAVRRR